MFYTNYIMLRIKLFMLSPIFPALLTIFICISFWSINSIILCDDHTVENLKNALLTDTVKFHVTMKDYKDYDDVR